MISTRSSPAEFDPRSHKHALALSRGLEAAIRDAIERLGNEVLRFHRVAGAAEVPGAREGQALAIQCLRFVYRIVVLLYVEAHPELGYGFERLDELGALELESPEARAGHDIHTALERLFTLVYEGTPKGKPEPEPHLRSPLFDPERTPALNLDTVQLRNEVLVEVLRALSLPTPPRRGKAKGGGGTTYTSLDIAQLGAAYESLLSFRGEFTDEGSFAYRQVGRDRQRSASYYTPEPLTRCLVSAALDELLEHDDGSPKHPRAEDLLELTICEPAMGSAAFLNETIHQLAERYLERRQAELGQRIADEDNRQALRRVRMFIADNNVFGVDLNPVALELAEVSLWLNATVADTGEPESEVFVPWLGRQLACGNALLGARREVFTREQLDAGPEGTRRAWLDAQPLALEPGRPRPAGSVYHFLLPARDMASYAGVKAEAALLAAHAESLERIEAWRTAIHRPLSEADIDELARLSDQIDELWVAHTEQALALREQTRTPLSVYGHPAAASVRHAPLSTKAKEHLAARAKLEGPHRCLASILDYWCALWFWPIHAAEDLPSRRAWLDAIAGLLSAAPRRDPRLDQVDALARHYRFFHWELECAAAFATRGGFDLVIGNPPWIKLEWKRDETDSDDDDADALVRELEGVCGQTAMLSAPRTYPELAGLTVNLYRNFIRLGSSLIHEQGCAAFIHPENLFESNRFAALRSQLYPRVRAHYQFQNALGLFPIAHRKRYGLTVFGAPRAIAFEAVFNLFHPSTLEHPALPGGPPAPGIKTPEGAWELRGHPCRRIAIDADELALFARLYASPETPPGSAPLPRLHSSELRPLLARAAACERQTSDLDGLYTDSGWNERDAPRHGILRKLAAPEFVERPLGLVLKGPHFNVATPLAKTPRRACTNKSHYDSLDLVDLPLDYLPRTAFAPALSDDDYRARARRVSSTRTALADYRVVVSRQLSLDGERTLQPALVPPGIAHIHSVFGLGLGDPKTLVGLAALWASLPLDFLVRLSGAQDMSTTLARKLPFAERWPEFGRVRALRLNALTIHYGRLWREVFDPAWREDAWLIEDPRTAAHRYADLGPTWTANAALRSAYARRRALIELDVWASAALDLELADLLSIYRVQFPVLRSYEANTWYDAEGRIVHTNNKSLPGVGLPSASRTSRGTGPRWEEVAHMSEEAGYTGTERVTQTVEDDTLPGGPRTRTIHYRAPWVRCDRERDYERAWQAFVRRYP